MKLRSLIAAGSMVAAGVALAPIAPTYADTVVTSCDGLAAAFQTGGLVTLGVDGCSLTEGLVVGADMTLDLNGNTLTVTGTTNPYDGGQAGIQTTGFSFTVEDTSSPSTGHLNATGGPSMYAGGGGAGIGGSGGRDDDSPDGGSGGTITIASGTVTAVGGAPGAWGWGQGGSAIGGGGFGFDMVTADGTSGNPGPGGTIVIGSDAVVTATQGPGAPSAIGSTGAGTGSTITNNGDLTLLGGQTQLDPFTNSGTIHLQTALVGSAPITNDGSIRLATGWSIDTSTVDIEHHGYQVGYSTDPAGTAPTRVFADSFQDAGVTLPTPPQGDAWWSAASGGQVVAATTDLQKIFGDQPFTPTTAGTPTVMLYARTAPPLDCATLQAGLQVDGTVTLNQDLTCLGLALASGVDVTLDLAGYTLNANSSELISAAPAGLRTTGATLTIKDSSSPSTGVLNATGLNAPPFFGAGIGGDMASGHTDGGTVIVDGGTINAAGGSVCAGIGGCLNGDGGTVTINGGTVTATGGDGAAGIGGGPRAAGDQVSITGGTVTATGGLYGAGIGGGESADGGTISIGGGVVTAIGGSGGSGGGTTYSGGTGMGGGGGPSPGSAGLITIGAGATVTAAGGSYASAAIGSNASGASGSIASAGDLTLKGPAQTENVAFTNSGTVHLQTPLSGGATLTNDGTILVESGGSVDTSTVDIEHHAYLVGYSTDAAGTAPTMVLADSFHDAGVGLAKPPAGDAWWSAASGGQVVKSTSDLQAIFGNETIPSSTAGAPNVTLYARPTPVDCAALQAALQAGGTVALDGDLTCADLAVGAGATVTLDLAGHTLNTAGRAGAALQTTGGTLTITDSSSPSTGVLNADSSSAIMVVAAGIGGSQPSAAGGTLVIDGGTINATGAVGGAGIGGADGGNGGTINIHGGTVAASGGAQSAGIGGGAGAGSGSVAVTGGTVTATGGQYGAGIGGGYASASAPAGTISITAGVVTATGGPGFVASTGTYVGGTGIGGGGGLDDVGPAGVILIDAGATVTATGGSYASAAIGSNASGASGAIGSGGDLTLAGPAQTENVAFTNSGTLHLQTPLSGGATLTNDGTILVESGGSVDTSSVDIEDHAYLVHYSTDPTGTAPTLVLADSFADAKVDMAAMPPSGSWMSAATGGQSVSPTTSLSGVFGPATITSSTANTTLYPSVVAPAVATTAGSSAFTEAAPASASTPVLVDPGVSVTAGSSPIAGATVAITGNLHAGQDVLGFTNTSAVRFGDIGASFDASAGTLTLTSAHGAVTDAQWQNALRAVTYRDTASVPKTATRTVSFAVSDTNGLVSNTATKDVTITATDQSPVLASTQSDSPTYVLGGGARAVDPTVTVTDADNSTLGSATVSISGGFAAGDTLGFVNDGATMGNITASYDGGNGVLTLASAGRTATLAQWRSALRSVTFSTTAGHGARSVGFQVSDGIEASNIVTDTVTAMRPVVAGDVAYTTPMDTALRVDAAHGLLSNSTGDGTLTFSSLSGAIHGQLALHPDGSFTYTPDAGYTGVVTFTFGVTSSDGATDTATATISVQAPPTYTVHFDTQGGSAAPADETVTDGDKATKPADPTWTGHTFEHWSVSKGGAAYDFANTPVTSALTLYAVWSLDSETVTFDTQGGGTAPAAESVDYGSNATRPADPTWAGHTFKHWSASKGGAAYDFANTPVTSALTLYAVWSSLSHPVSVTVTFDTGAGSAVAPESVDYGTPASKPADPTWAGHTFTGWATDSSGTTTYDFSAKVTADLKLYAQWTASPVTPVTPVTPQASGAVSVPMCHGRVATIVATPGERVVVGTRGDDVIVGTPGADVIRGMGGNDVICAGAGNDRVRTGSGRDVIDGGAGNDRVHTGGGDDRVAGGRGRDRLWGGAGDDVMYGGGSTRLPDARSSAPRGSDVLHGGAGDDVLWGDGGPDRLLGGPGRNHLHGGTGRDFKR